MLSDTRKGYLLTVMENMAWRVVNLRNYWLRKCSREMTRVKGLLNNVEGTINNNIFKLESRKKCMAGFIHCLGLLARWNRLSFRKLAEIIDHFIQSR